MNATDIAMRHTGDARAEKMPPNEHRFRKGDRVNDSGHGPGTVMGWDRPEYVDIRFDSGRRDCAWARRLTLIEDEAPEVVSGVATCAEAAAREHVIVILQVLRGVMLAIEAETIDRRYVDFGVLAGKVQACIDGVRSIERAAVTH